MRGCRALVVALALCPLAGCNPIYHPGSAPSWESAGNAGMSEVSYRTADGLTLSGWYGAARGDLPTLVYFHGSAGYHGGRARLIAPYLDAGYGVLLAGYRGYGDNPGWPSESGLYDDGRAALDWLEESGATADRLVLYGESLGTGVAVQMAIERQTAALVLQAPFTSTVDVGEDMVPWLPVSAMMTDRYDNLSKIGRISMPLLVIHGEDDQIVPVRFGRELFDAAPDPKTAHFLPEAGHNNLADFAISDLVLDYLAALPASPSPGAR